MIHWTKGEDIQLSENFSTSEFECKCTETGCKQQKIEQELIKALQSLREHLGTSVKVTSGYRCESHNKKVGGVRNSSHIRGLAADLVVSDQEKLRELMENLYKCYSIGRYDDFTHIDTRKEFRRW